MYSTKVFFTNSTTDFLKNHLTKKFPTRISKSLRGGVVSCDEDEESRCDDVQLLQLLTFRFLVGSGSSLRQFCILRFKEKLGNLPWFFYFLFLIKPRRIWNFQPSQNLIPVNGAVGSTFKNVKKMF